MIAAIVVAVALPELGNADTAIASEVVGSAGAVHARASRICVRRNTAGAHALAVLHDHIVGAQADELVVWRAEADVRALSIVGALVRAGLNAVSEYLKSITKYKYAIHLIIRKL